MATKQKPFYHSGPHFALPPVVSPEFYSSSLKYSPRNDDVFVVTYPKCGTTWCQQIILQIYREGEPIKNFRDYFSSSLYLEMVGCEAVEKMKRPAPIKSHLPFDLIPYSSYAKYIYMTRNPKDCCVSYYHHTKQLGAYNYEEGQFDDYFELFLNGEVDYGSYFDHVISWYQKRNEENVLFLDYESARSDTQSLLSKMAQFLGCCYYDRLKTDQALLNNILHHTSFDYMRGTVNGYYGDLFSVPTKDLLADDVIPAGRKTGIINKRKTKNTINFVREGKVGKWREYLSSDQNRRMDEKIREKFGCCPEIIDNWKKLDCF